MQGFESLYTKELVVQETVAAIRESKEREKEEEEGKES